MENEMEVIGENDQAISIDEIFRIREPNSTIYQPIEVSVSTYPFIVKFSIASVIISLLGGILMILIPGEGFLIAVKVQVI